MAENKEYSSWHRRTEKKIVAVEVDRVVAQRARRYARILKGMTSKLEEEPIQEGLRPEYPLPDLNNDKPLTGGWLEQVWVRPRQRTLTLRSGYRITSVTRAA